MLGFGGTGKSHFLASCPNTFIFNFDLSPTTNPNPLATIFPFIDENGTPIDENGKFVALDWKTHIIPKRDLLIKMGLDQDPSRPTTVVIDTGDTAIRLAREYAAKEYGKSTVEDAGQAGWTRAYSEISTLFHDLYKVGYGVWVTGRLANEEIKNERGDIIGMRETTRASSNFFSYFEPYCDFVGKFTVEQEQVTVKIPVEVALGGGRTITQTKDTTELQNRYLFVTQDPRLPYFLRCRGVNASMMKRVALPNSGGYDVLNRAYEAAFNSKTPEPLKETA